MAQGVRAHATTPDDLSSNTETHMVEGENQFPKLFSSLHTWTLAYVRAHTRVCKLVKTDIFTQHSINSETHLW